MSSSTPPAHFFAHNTLAEARRLEKARVLARWCYDRGIDARILDVAPERLRYVARQAGVAPPHHEDTGSPTWQLVADLLTQRSAWDRAHAVTAPPPAACVECAIDGASCSGCASRPPITSEDRAED